jgi:MFS family permease
MSTPTSAGGEWRRFWTLPVAAAFGYSTAVLHTYAIGPFMEPIGAEFGWSRTQLSAGITITGLAGAVFSIPVGLMVDRIGPRIVGLIGVVLMTGAFALLGTATGDTGNWLMLWSLLAFANLWLQATVWTTAVASRFEKSRGLAFGIALCGASLSAFVFPRLATYLIDTYGWRTGFMAMGGLWAAIVLPVTLLFFRGAKDAGHKVAAEATTAAQTAEGVTVTDGLRTLAFWKLFFASGFFTFTVLGLVVHLVPLLTAAGSERAAAAQIASLIGIFSIIGRLGTGWLLDRLSGRVIGAVIFLLPIAAAALLILDAGNPTYQMIAAAIFGLTVGAEVDVIAYLASRQLGLKNFGVLFGAMVGALSVGVAFGPLAAGAAFDQYGSYAPFLMLTMVLMALSALALATLGKPRFGAGHG